MENIKKECKRIIEQINGLTRATLSQRKLVDICNRIINDELTIKEDKFENYFCSAQYYKDCKKMI
jgi:hypothetical protein